MAPSSLSRRRFLQSTAALAGGLSLPAWAAGPSPLRGDEALPAPDFSLLRESNPHLIGVRPHRKGGVRLEVEPLTETAGKKRYLVHNYGHGGAGITLSWGCASVATELIAPLLAGLEVAKQPASVAVLGTGVIGLTLATELHRNCPALPITVYAKDLDVRTTTSFVAGGQFEPSGIYNEYGGSAERKQLLGLYLQRSRDRIVGLQRSGQRELFGVAERKNYTLDHPVRAFDEFTPTDVVPKYRSGTLPFEKLNARGREYSNWLMNPTILLPKLAADLAASGVAFVQRTFESRKDVLALSENLILNCTGYGAKALFGDANLIPQRGHLVVLKKTLPRQFWFFSGGCENLVTSYVFCRQDDIVVGGTVQPGNESTASDAKDEAVFARLLSNARELFNGHPAACRV